MRRVPDIIDEQLQRVTQPWTLNGYSLTRRNILEALEQEGYSIVPPRSEFFSSGVDALAYAISQAGSLRGLSALDSAHRLVKELSQHGYIVSVPPPASEPAQPLQPSLDVLHGAIKTIDARVLRRQVQMDPLEYAKELQAELFIRGYQVSPAFPPQLKTSGPEPQSWTPVWKHSGRKHMAISFQIGTSSTEMVRSLSIGMFDEIRQTSPTSWEVRFA